MVYLVTCLKKWSWIKFRRGSWADSWIAYRILDTLSLSEYKNNSVNFLNSGNYFRTVRIKRSGQLKRNANYFQLTGFSRDLWKRSKNSLPDRKIWKYLLFSLGIFSRVLQVSYWPQNVWNVWKCVGNFLVEIGLGVVKCKFSEFLTQFGFWNYITRKQSLFEPKTSIRPDYFWAEKPYVNQNSYLSQELLSV